jgi:hypothetical protein
MRSCDVGPVELIDVHIESVEGLDGAVNAGVVRRSRRRAEGRAAERAPGESFGAP